MENEFVPYELAIKLKAIGFDEPCFGCYDDKAVFGLTVMSIKQYYTNSKEDTWNCAAPLYQQAFRWFREKGLRFCIIDDYSSNETPYSFTTDHEYYYDTGSGNNWYKTYKEAELACLRKLVELYYNENYGGNNKTQDLHNP